MLFKLPGFMEPESVLWVCIDKSENVTVGEARSVVCGQLSVSVTSRVWVWLRGATLTVSRLVYPPADLKAILSFTINLARKAGVIIIEGSVAIQSASSKDSDVIEKKNSVDLVTEYDVRVEELVKKELKTQYPTFLL